jgi:RNA polymerase sigma factor (sigma-70 family)
MPTTMARVVRRCLHALSAHTPDADLLRRYARDRDADAFAELVARHGPVVLGVCHRALGHTADAEDAFQATFLALARNARTVRDPARLPGWLHRVALRAARRARTRRRPALPLDDATDLPAPPESHDLSWREGLAVLDEELNALPDRLRAPLVLCYLDGLTRDEAALRLGWSLAMLKRRLEEGRTRLRERLVRRGVSAAVLAAAAGTGDGLRAALPPDLLVRATSLPGHAPPDAVRTLAADLGAIPRFVHMRVIVVGLTVLAGGLVLSARTEDQPAKGPPPREVAEKPLPPRAFEAPLPPGAVARLGSSRFRHTDGVNNSALTPDGKWLATTGRGTIFVWDLETGERRHEFRPADVETGSFFGPVVALSPDGKWLADRVASGARARVWDLTTGKHRTVGTRAPDDAASGRAQLDAFEFSPDGKELLLLSDSGVTAFDPATGRQLRTVPAGGRGLVAAPRANVFLARVPDLAAAAPPHGTRPISILTCDLATGKELSRFEASDEDFSGLATLSADGRRAAVVVGRDVQVWDTRSGKAVVTCRLPPEPAVRGGDGWGFTRIALSPNGAVLYVGQTTGEVRAFDLAKPGEGKVLGRHLRYVTGLKMTADGRRLISTSWDGVIRRWDLTTGKEIPPPDGYSQRLAIARSPNGGTIAVGALNGRLDLYDHTGRLNLTIRDRGPGILRVAFSPDGKRLAAACGDGTLRLWDTSSGAEAKRIDYPKLHPNSVPYHLLFTPDGRRLVVPYSDDWLWDIESGKPVTDGRPRTFSPVAFSPDGKWIVTESAEQLAWFEAGTGRAVRRFRIEALPGTPPARLGPNSVAFSADGRTIVSAHDDGAVRVWDAETGRLRHGLARIPSRPPAEPEPLSDRDRVWWAQVSPDGRWVAAGTGRGKVRVWEVATGAEVRTWDGHDGEVWDGVWGRDARTLLTTAGSEALLWSLRPPDLAPAANPQTLWDDLAGEPAKAFRAQWSLLDDPKSAAKLLRDRQAPAKAPADDKRVRQLIADLDSDTFRTREQATKALRDLGRPVVPSLQAGQRAAGTEGRKRLGELIDELTTRLTANDLRQMRAVQVLELASTPEAKAVLTEWAAGQPGVLLTVQAADALKRLDGRAR